MLYSLVSDSSRPPSDWSALPGMSRDHPTCFHTSSANYGHTEDTIEDGDFIVVTSQADRGPEGLFHGRGSEKMKGSLPFLQKL